MNSKYTRAVFVLDNVTKIFAQPDKDLVVLHDVTYTFEQGISYGISGVSGSGKSTLLHILAGLEAQQREKFFLMVTNLAQLSEDDYRFFLNNTIGLVFQDAYLLQELTVLENTIIKGLLRGTGFDVCAREGLDLLAQLGLEGLEHKKPSQLSGGQAQRVALARALYGNPGFVLADEPTAHLDENSAQVIIQLMIKYQKKSGCGLIVSSHDPRVLNQLERRCVVHEGMLRGA